MSSHPLYTNASQWPQITLSTSSLLSSQTQPTNLAMPVRGRPKVYKEPVGPLVELLIKRVKLKNVRNNRGRIIKYNIPFGDAPVREDLVPIEPLLDGLRSLSSGTLRFSYPLMTQAVRKWNKIVKHMQVQGSKSWIQQSAHQLVVACLHYATLQSTDQQPPDMPKGEASLQETSNAMGIASLAVIPLQAAAPLEHAALAPEQGSKKSGEKTNKKT